MRRAGGWLALVAMAACQGEGRGQPKPPEKSAGSGGSATPSSSVPPSSGSDDGAVAPPKAPQAPLTGPQVIAKLSAIAAWEGVVQRGQYLERRGQRGALYGRIGAKPEGAADNHVWLLDDTEGEGSLAVRAAFPDGVPAPGSRVVVTGAWKLQEPVAPSAPAPAAPSPPSAPAPAAPSAPAPPTAPPAPHDWVWQVDSATLLSDDPAAFTPTSPVGHDIKTAPRPAEAVPISKAKDNDLVIFAVLAAPRRLGEAWLVGDQLGSPPIAMLSMPGDRASYGGIDFRQPDEQWRLRRGVTYVVRIGKIRRKDPSKPATINARNAPIKL